MISMSIHSFIIRLFCENMQDTPSWHSRNWGLQEMAWKEVVSMLGDPSFHSILTLGISWFSERKSQELSLFSHIATF